MNNRFKFRVWDKYMQGYVKENLGEKYVWIEDDGQLGAGIDDNDCILEQCTGLKDKNGNLIYEGDIVADGYCKRTVIWDGWYWNAKAKSNCPLDNITCSIVEIIGNIHKQAE